MYSSFGLYWNGDWQTATGKGIPVISPVTEEVLGEAPGASEADTLQSIESAVLGTRAMAEGWCVGAFTSARKCRNYARKTEEMARWLTMELGKTTGSICR